MTEADWLKCATPQTMLDHLQENISDRKLGLFACACGRQVRHLLSDNFISTAIEIAERFADGELVGEELQAALAGAWVVPGNLAWLGEPAMWNAPWIASWAVARTAALALAQGAREDPGPQQTVLLREIVGNPFRPLRPRTFPAHLVALAQECYNTFPDVSDQFPILADALADLGEEGAAAHCREEGHVKGCHVLDWILARE